MRKYRIHVVNTPNTCDVMADNPKEALEKTFPQVKQNNKDFVSVAKQQAVYCVELVNSSRKQYNYYNIAQKIARATVQAVKTVSNTQYRFGAGYAEWLLLDSHGKTYPCCAIQDVVGERNITTKSNAKSLAEDIYNEYYIHQIPATDKEKVIKVMTDSIYKYVRG